MNLKNRFDFKSIRFKLWIYFIGFAMLLIGLIWFLQIFFLNNYYDHMKTGEITKIANAVIDTYEDSGNDPYRLAEVLNDIYATNEDIYIQVDSLDGSMQIAPRYAEHISLYRYKYNLQMQTLLAVAEEMGACVTVNDEGVGVDVIHKLKACSYLKTEVHPGFPTDLQSPLMAALSIARGQSVIEENIFENRFRIVNDLLRMGANIEVIKNKAYINGVERLKGADVEAEELRGGAALVVAGLAAEGKSVVRNRHFIERGYENICKDLRNLGADINII